MDQGLVLYLISFLFLKGCEKEKTNVWLTECTCLQGRATHTGCGEAIMNVQQEVV